ncbi:hypothetical protein A2334_02315 [Candidatus Roizmanbacteria bacterium RIFOXYB2_FULL_38_10]|uniref:SUF system FeS cluster assembly SufBD core domain-containing protein n=1 Tax=Candidatus Roizmanbacteria bacterium RIFOXYD1_FULL_38_12 TaxID=1802093 RepID=A0A1F7L016_9BACT|nr:MAG: hypothetical protein A3K47_01655 [Candidatus Roizmanbacteria bacterium RIFOXYA2_FULL_38_14]OGK63489.1 MAG: hypothetical protein A3K27_01655 [Candidatus Roizmanbacteria bacterium RIFOXYA1_FULL_37_12]OGK65335.1 MAG: hypothetical protein A3K38_01655 [Candidatus Roizmanbacteria bacterium RIFOXYB1_FULL_40_23]OGK67951.1 MAG: hypothetical protein A2334_02315 [Candidatus Roizmanbacteria bacterium RIFOXYB2_FULL_38_10]OGK69740.1 MAG: hypothetical protein A3K21_01660 [Candidatus Roizmanbacteria ba
MEHTIFTLITNITKTSKKNLSFSKSGKYIVFFYNLSGELTFRIKSRGVELYIFGLYTGAKKNTFRLKTIQHHLAPESKSDLYIGGVFGDSSTFFHEGLIKVDRDAQKTHAYQINQNIILSKEVFISSKPDLEILANDVFCTHASTTGKLNKEELFSIQSRGVDRNNSERLMINGFIKNIFRNIETNGRFDELEKNKKTILKQYA